MAAWKDNDAEWFEERMIHCGACGRMIAKRYLEERFPGGSEKFCGQECLTLYTDYVLVERGEAYRPPEDIGGVYVERMVR